MQRKSRRKSRIDAIVMLYQSDLLNRSAREILQRELLLEKKIDEFTLKLVTGVEEHREEIDKLIMDVVENWTLERIAVVDRNILRVAIYEMLYEDEIPPKVSIDEAIEISKRLGEKDETPKFVNGILGKILIKYCDKAKTQNYEK